MHLEFTLLTLTFKILILLLIVVGVYDVEGTELIEASSLLPSSCKFLGSRTGYQDWLANMFTC